MVGIVVYKGKYGSTRQYAEWIAADLSFDCRSTDEAGGAALEGYDTVVVGSSVEQGKLLASKWLEANLRLISGKKVLLFSVSGAGPEEKAQHQEILERSVAPEFLGKFRFFPLHGRQVMANYPLLLRLVLKLVALGTKDPKAKAGIASDWDYVSRDQILPIVQAAKA